jgi:hypothetical protein
MNGASITAVRVTLAIVAAVVLQCPVSTSAVAQSGMEWKEFTKKLDPYFADDLIEDLRTALPQGTSFRVWGWDVGDFSGDGVTDVAFSINILGTRKRECVVYMFVDVDGFLINVSKQTLSYVDLPLEVGVVIRDGACYVTQKRKAEAWTIMGYQYREGAHVLLDEFVSDKVGGYGRESYRNYRTLETWERYISKKGEEEFRSEYLTIPVYHRGRQVVAGYVSDVVVDRVKYVHEGAYWWKGPEDCSYKARAVYDDDFLYLRIDVADDKVVTGWCDTCAADRVDIWFDASEPDASTSSRSIGTDAKGNVVFRGKSDSGLYVVSIRIGDFEDVRPTVRVRTTDDLSPEQEAAVRDVRVVTALRADGYVVKVRIPFLLMGFSRAPIDDSNPVDLGCTIAVYDVDNEFRPEETSIIATSELESLHPASYGALRLLSGETWYGQARNIYSEAVFQTLRDLGF